jgi:hypothetical protein
MGEWADRERERISDSVYIRTFLVDLVLVAE